MQRLKKLPAPAYSFVVRINVNNLLIMKEAPPPSPFDFWDVGEA